MCQVIKAPSRTPISGRHAVFLAGITSGEDANWRDAVIAALADLPHITVLDPSRPDWDSTWREDVSFGPFADQVRWELEMQDRADVVVVNFGGGAAIGGAEPPKAAISLLELGLRAGSGRRCRVVCRDGYWKKGNVQLVCERYGVEISDNVDALIRALVAELGELDEDRSSVTA